MPNRDLRQPGLLIVLLIAALAVMGCASHQSKSTTDNSSNGPSGTIDPQQVQTAIMAFADRYATTMADAYLRAEKSNPTLDARVAAEHSIALAGMGAWGNAVNSNPIAGLMDMALMVTLTREITEEPWAAQTFGAQSVEEVLAALKIQEKEIWNLAAKYLTPAQIDELRQLAAQWLKEHPDQRFVAGAHLVDFPEAKQAAAGDNQLIDSVFGLVTLNPFNGLDPAVREVEESRVLAERVFYYVRHLPIMISWEIQGLYDDILASPEIQKLFENTTTIAGSTTRFSEDGSRFADATGRFADTIEHFRKQLPAQQAELVTQLNALVARQRSAALDQATTQVSAQRDVTIRELNSTVAAQQDAMAKNLQAITDHSIDRLYVRLRSLIFIAVGSILVAFLLYRVVVGRHARAEK